MRKAKNYGQNLKKTFRKNNKYESAVHKKYTALLFDKYLFLFYIFAIKHFENNLNSFYI
jgi:hypothetical protein